MAKDHARGLPKPLERGAYTARFAETGDDLTAAQRLRHLCFVEKAGRAPLQDGIEGDAFDALCDHVLVEDSLGRLVCCFRVHALASGAEIKASYAAQYYDLERLSGFSGALVELGRFCVDPAVLDGDVLRIAWGMLAAFVDSTGAQMLFGCASFAGTDPSLYGQAFDVLTDRHLAPDAFMPTPKASETVPFAKTASPVGVRSVALAQVPSLLKTYLSMGGWVSDHAVVDRDMNTLHVFTGLEIAKIPPARAAALRAIAG